MNNIIYENLKVQSYKYPEIHCNTEIQSFISNYQLLPEKEIYNLSLQIEPRNATKLDIQ